MTEKYLSGVEHPSQTLESFRHLDFVDKEKFIEMLLNEQDAHDILMELIVNDAY